MATIHKVGIIGYGGMASHHFETLKGFERVKIKGVFDVNPERGKVAEEQGLVSYPSKEAILSDEELDMILIATTNEVHKELIIEAMKCGKNVICEKPVTMTSKELEEAIQAAKKYKKVFTIDQNRR
ncbi:MAG: Gfo/Idh/MocA family oxidoreductase, partial [Oscillospiraceae bacterium]